MLTSPISTHLPNNHHQPAGSGVCLNCGQATTSRFCRDYEQRTDTHHIQTIEERRQLTAKPVLDKKEKIRLKKLDNQISYLPITEIGDEKILEQIREAILFLEKKGIFSD